MEILLSAILIGLSLGIAPGPLMIVVVSETLRHGIKAGMKVAIAPFITDAPIIITTVFILSTFADVNILLAIISLLGAFYLLYLSYESITVKPLYIADSTVEPQPLRKGVLANLLNPAPYIFYLTVGGAIIIKASKINPFLSIVFIVSFLTCLVFSKMLIAVIVASSRDFLRSNLYLTINRFLGIFLLFFVYSLLKQATHFLFP